MVLTKSELIDALCTEGRILLHLATKVDRAQLDYRQTPKQRSTLDLLQYMAIMGPTQLAVIEKGVLDRPTLSAMWGPAETAAKKIDFEQAVAAIAPSESAIARRVRRASRDRRGPARRFVGALVPWDRVIDRD